MKYTFSEIVQETDKVKRVITSIKNKDQLKYALNYFQLWQSKYSADMRVTNYTLSQCDCFCLGYLLGFLANNVPNSQANNADKDAEDNGIPS